MKKALIITLSSLISLNTAAKTCNDTPQLKSPWDGTNASINGNINTGNTNAKNIGSALNIAYAKNRWTWVGQAQSQWAKSNGTLNKEKYYFSAQGNYAFNQAKSEFVFGQSNVTFDTFSPYAYQLVIAGGYGRDLYKSDTTVFSMQVGPGLRRNKDRATEVTGTRSILTTATHLSWKLSAAGTITQNIRFDYGSPYDYLQTVTAFTNKIVGNLALQVSYQTDYYTSIPPASTNTEKLDTTTAISLVYNFS